MLNIWKQKLKDIKEKCEKLNIMELRTILDGIKIINITIYINITIILVINI